MAGRQEKKNVKVEIAISCTNLVQRDRFARSVEPLCILYFKSRGTHQWKEVGRTERLHNTLNPEWSQTLVLDYYFEEKQMLKFCIYNWVTNSRNPQDQESWGSMECSLAELLATNGRFERGIFPYRQNIGDSGLVSVYAEEHTGHKDTITFEFTGSNLDKKDLFSESDPFFTVARSNPDDSWTVVYRSDYIKDEPSPEWPAVTIMSDKLCNGDWSRRLKVEIFDYNDSGEHDFIGQYYTNLEEMAEGEGFQIVTWDVINEKKKLKKGGEYENSGTVILKSISIDRDTTFLDYIRGGLKLHFVVAVDFTKSNGMPNDPGSLHYLDRERQENPYIAAIRSIGEIVQDYNFDKRFLGLGFGGQVNGRVSHCFPLNGSSRDPYCQGIDGLVDAYYDSLENVPLSDPTCFAPVIDYVRGMAERMQNGSNYVVLLLITDGGITATDMNATKRYLVHTANTFVPVSVVIVGVGKADKEKMRILDADNKTLTSHEGVRAKRDIVQFVELSDYLPGGRLDPVTFQNIMDGANIRYNLAKDVLAEVPFQVVDYMERNGFQPGVPEVQTALKMQQLQL